MAATGNFILDKGYDASGALAKYKAVKLTGAQLVSPVAAKTDVIIGVAQFGVAASEIARGKGAAVRVAGASVMVAGGTCTVGGLAGLMPDGSVHDAVTGDRVIGIFREGTATVGGYASVMLGLPGNII